MWSVIELIRHFLFGVNDGIHMVKIPIMVSKIALTNNKEFYECGV